jgi:hypothetical protein
MVQKFPKPVSPTVKKRFEFFKIRYVEQAEDLIVGSPNSMESGHLQQTLHPGRRKFRDPWAEHRAFAQ